MLKPTERFSNRVENYVKYRPSYPREIITLLGSECGLTPQSRIADVGSGTGLLTKLFLENGNRVFGVEPNLEMRQAGENAMRDFPNFVSINGKAEETTLNDHSVDFVVAGQAFHWFDRAKTRPEFVRILKPDGWLVLAWNYYQGDKSPLMLAYHQIILKYGTDYTEVAREIEGCEVDSFYAPGACEHAQFEFQQMFDYEGLKGRLLSASYVPAAGDPGYAAMLSDLEEAFVANAVDGKIVFEYRTEVFYGRLPER